MGHNLRNLRLRRGWRLEDAAEAFGLSPSGYNKLEYGDRKLSAERINKAAMIYAVTPAEVLADTAEIAVVGTVGHGGIVIYQTKIEENNPSAPRSPDATSETVALSVGRGVNVPGVADENCFIYHNEKRLGVPDEWIGKLCIVQVAGADAVIRRVFRGSQFGKFDLVGSGFETIRDAEAVWSARVEWVKPL